MTARKSWLRCSPDDQILRDSDSEYFTDGSSFVKEGEHLTGYSMVTLNSIISAKPLPRGTLAQKAELIALIPALQRVAGICVNIYTDSKYAIPPSTVHGALCKEKDLITSGGKDIK